MQIICILLQTDNHATIKLYHRLSYLSTLELNVIYKPHHNHNRFTAFFPEPPGWAGEREKNFWTLWCKERLTEADITQTIRLGATLSRLTSAHLHHPPLFYRPDALPAAQPTVSKQMLYIKRYTNLQASVCTILPHDVMLAQYMPPLCVCLSQVSVLLKQINVGSCNQRHMIAQGL